MVLHPVLPGDAGGRTPEQRLEEAVGLARAIELEVAAADILRVPRASPSALFGGGAVADIAARIEGLSIGLVVVNASLTGVQQRTLERAWNTKVIDRTGLILEIFGARARSHEGRLQVELAALRYARSRLVRSWTHLERQRGGLGFVGGPGESQIEIDRRLIGARITRLERALETVRRTRGLHRRARQRAPHPVVALVGYTNAGKSTLFNRLTGAGVMARDMLFATLDTTMRAVDLPGGGRALLSDTVGFIADLPTALIAAFRATLEELAAADLILHVRDAASPDGAAQATDVAGTLAALGLMDADGGPPVITALNKADLLSPEERADTLARARRENGGPVHMASAATGEGLKELLRAVEERISASDETLTLTVPHADGGRLAWLYRHGRVRARRETRAGVALTVRLPRAAAGRYRRRFGDARP